MKEGESAASPLARARGVQRTIRRLLLLVAVVLVALFLSRYDIEHLPPSVHDLEGRVRAGALMILGGIEADTPLGAGSLVEVVMEGPEGRRVRFFSEIAGVPGQVISLKPIPGKGLGLYLDGRTTWKVLPANTPLRPGPIPEGMYLLLDPNPPANGPDSRRLGLIPRAALRRRILFAL